MFSGGKMIKIRCLISLHFHFQKKTFSTQTIRLLQLRVYPRAIIFQFVSLLLKWTARDGGWIVTCKIDINFLELSFVGFLFFDYNFHSFLLSNWDVSWRWNRLRGGLNLWWIELWIWSYARVIAGWTWNCWWEKLRLWVADAKWKQTWSRRKISGNKNVNNDWSSNNLKGSHRYCWSICAFSILLSFALRFWNW